jgi:hypothetical protein
MMMMDPAPHFLWLRREWPTINRPRASLARSPKRPLQNYTQSVRDIQVGPFHLHTFEEQMLKYGNIELESAVWFCLPLK